MFAIKWQARVCKLRGVLELTKELGPDSYRDGWKPEYKPLKTFGEKL
jgi:hypothetical protein